MTSVEQAEQLVPAFQRRLKQPNTPSKKYPTKERKDTKTAPRNQSRAMKTRELSAGFRNGQEVSTK